MSQLAQQGGDITPLEAAYRFDQLFQCAVEDCGEIVCVHGRAELVDNPDPVNDEDQYVYMLFPRSMYPGPPLATIPEQTPDAVADELRKAFQLFWVDLGACANRLRISVERALDELGLPAARTLNDRIRAFENLDPDHAETFHALREVGNVGSHDGDNSRETVLDAFEIYQDALRNLFGGHKLRIDALKQKIRATKGK